MLLKKILGITLSATLFLSSFGIASAETPETVQGKLAAIEQETYGDTQRGAVMERINKLEQDYNGSHMKGNMMARVDAIYDQLYGNDAEPSILAKVNAMEWSMSHEVSMRPIEERITDLELSINGKTEEGTFVKRISDLSSLSFGDAELPMSVTSIPANTLIKVALAEPVNAKNIREGDTVRYTVAEDVTVDGNLVFAKGEPGDGIVTKVRQAKNFGRDAEVIIDFKRIQAIDGTYVDTFVGEQAKKEMKNMAMAAGASLAGMVILGPVGVITGVFVNGKNVDLPAGTEVYIQTKADENIYGVQTTLSGIE